MSGFSFMSHGSQDLYPTLLVKQYRLSPDTRTIVLVIVNIGAMLGGIFFGQLSELLGRRLTLVTCVALSGAFIYPAFFSIYKSGLVAGYFFLNFCVMGAWGVAPIHLLELVNPQNRAFWLGIVYQLGNLASLASITIEATMGDVFPPRNNRPDYALVMAIFCGAVFANMLVIVFFGPERFHGTDTVEEDVDEEEEEDKDKEEDVENVK